MLALPDGPWSELSGALVGPAPTARDSHGFAEAGGRLFVHGGEGDVAGAKRGSISGITR